MTNVNVKGTNEKVPISSLEFGDYFLIRDSILWIYLEKFTPIDDDDEEFYEPCNAFCLDTGTIDYFPGDLMVTLVKNVDITYTV